MSIYGKSWSIDGVPARSIRRRALNGSYTVTFEREYTALEEIEGINWAAPVVEGIIPRPDEPGLPAGYGFDVVDIQYRYSAQAYEVHIQTAAQYLGDVSACQAQVEALEAAALELEAEMESAYTEGVDNYG